MFVSDGLRVITIAQAEEFSLILGKKIMYTVPEISTNKFFLRILSCHYGFTNYFKTLNFHFLNILPGGVSTC